jgi:hypothetical protein
VHGSAASTYPLSVGGTDGDTLARPARDAAPAAHAASGTRREPGAGATAARDGATRAGEACAGEACREEARPESQGQEAGGQAPEPDRQAREAHAEALGAAPDEEETRAAALAARVLHAEQDRGIDPRGAHLGAEV